MPWLLALALGLALGVVLHRGDFCMTTVLHGILDGRAGSAVHAYLLALALDLVAVAVLAGASATTLAVARPLTLGVVVGGLALGAGMVLGRGCMLSVWSRAGAGSVGALVAAAAVVVSMTTVAGLWPALPAALTADVGAPAMWLGPAPWAGLGVAVVIVLALWSLPRASPRTRRWPWPLTGAAIGLAGAAAWLVSAPGDVAWGLSLAPPREAIAAGGRASLAWPLSIAAGIFAGAWLSADLRGGVVWRVPEPREVARRLAGGALMGAGAALGSACSAGQALTGLSTLSLSAVVATAAMLLGGKLAATLAGAGGSGPRVIGDRRSNPLR